MGHGMIASSLLFLLLVGCASVDKNTDELAFDGVEASTTTKRDEEVVEKVTENINKSYIYSCEGCIVGSSSKESIDAEGRQAYYLEGFDEFNLTNRWFDIPVEDNKDVRRWVNFYKKRARNHFRIHGKRAGRYAPIMSDTLAEYKLPRDLIFLAMAESGFNNSARSHMAAVGPWQFIRSTGKNFGLKINYYLDERRNPIKSSIAAATFLKSLHEMFGHWHLAKAGYNAGPGKVSRAVKKYDSEDFWEISKGRYLKSETKNYVPKIMALAIVGKNLEAFGFDNFEFMEPLQYEEIEVPMNADLYRISDKIGLSFKEVKRYNPELARWQTPPGKGVYSLKIPIGKGIVWNEADNQAVKKKSHKYYKIKTGGTLGAVASKYNLRTEVLEYLNPGIGRRHLNKGKLVKLPYRSNHGTKLSMYSDLYRSRRRRRGKSSRNLAYSRLLKKSRKLGKKIRNPKEFYVVKNGDSLWDVAKKTGVSINTIVRSNYGLARRGIIRPGDKLVIR